MSKKVHWIRNETYYYPVLIFIGTWPQCSSYMNKNYKIDIGDQYAGGGAHIPMMNEKHVGSDFSLVWMPSWDQGDWTDVRVLSHELLHVAINALKVCGVKFSYKHQEALCYLHEDFNRMAHGALNE